VETNIHIAKATHKVLSLSPEELAGHKKPFEFDTSLLVEHKIHPLNLLTPSIALLICRDTQCN